MTSAAAALDSSGSRDASLLADESGPPASTIAKKDKQCPFCNQAFTSSSLGRHLDLYIKDVNPKPPDGIHNVEDIRKIRATITRRQPKGSKQRDRSLDNRHSSSAPPSASKPSSPPPQPSRSYVQAQSSISQGTGRPLSDIYKLQWTATGVINNIPNRSGAESASNHATPVEDAPTYRAWDRATPADMALREILREVSLAQARLQIAKLFDFDFFTSTFPTLVMKLLKPPPVSLEALPYHVRDFWPRDGVPARESYDNVFHRVEQRVRSQYEALRKIENGASTGLTPRVEEEVKRHLSHLDAVYAEWQSSRDRESAWHLAIMSEIRVEREARKQAEEKAERLTSEIENLRTQINAAGHRRVGSTPMTGPREIAPNHINDDVAAELTRAGIDLSNWNYEALISKWKNILGNSGQSHPALGAGWQPHASQPASNGSPLAHNGTPSGTFPDANRVLKRPAETPLGGRPAPSTRVIRYDDEDGDDDDDMDRHGDTPSSDVSPQIGPHDKG